MPTPYEQGYQDQLEKLGFSFNPIKGLKNMFGGAKAVAPTAQATQATQKGLLHPATQATVEKLRSHGQIMRDYHAGNPTGYGKGIVGAYDETPLAQVNFRKQLHAVPAQTKNYQGAQLQFPSGKELEARSQAAFKQIQQRREAMGRPFANPTREQYHQFQSDNKQQRMQHMNEEINMDQNAKTMVPGSVPATPKYESLNLNWSQV